MGGFIATEAGKCSCQSVCRDAPPFQLGAHRVFASGFYASPGPRLQHSPLPPPSRSSSSSSPHTRSWAFSRRRPVVFSPLTSSLSSLVSLSFQWPSVAWFALSSAIVNKCRMRPHSSRPLQYEDGVGGSQRRAASSGTNTGNRRVGKCRHGKIRMANETQEPSRAGVLFYFL